LPGYKTLRPRLTKYCRGRVPGGVDAYWWKEGHPACKKLEWWGIGMVICLEQGACLHTAQLMPLPLTVSCFSKIQIGFYLFDTGSPG